MMEMVARVTGRENDEMVVRGKRRNYGNGCQRNKGGVGK